MVPRLDFDRLKELKEELNMPLVLHGGSGAGEENIKKAVAYGINKINVCTDLFRHAVNVTTVSYTHLDVYKRQPSSFYYLFRDRFVSPVDFPIHYTLSLIHI